MSTTPFVVRPYAAQQLHDETYDAIVCACGFEERCRFIAETIRPKGQIRVATAYQDRQVLSFRENTAAFDVARYELEQISDDEYPGWVAKLLQSLDQSTCAPSRVLVDISSLSRQRIAAWIEAVSLRQHRRALSVDFAYVLPKFKRPVSQSAVMQHAGPVSPAFAGCIGDPESPLVAMLGIGFEQGRALGAIEFIDPSRIWLLWPLGGDNRFQRELHDANDGLFAAWKPFGESRYSVLNPYDEFIRLESLTFGLSQGYRMVFLPFGPKILALLCLLVAAIHRDTSVWRVSAGNDAEPIDVAADGALAVLRLTT